MLRAVAWMMAAWVAYGVSVSVVLSRLGVGLSGVAVGIGAFALAWVLGFVVLISPAGAGARDAALVALLSPTLSGPEALSVALISRVVLTIGDLGLAAAGGLYLSRQLPADTGVGLSTEDPPPRRPPEAGTEEQPNRYRVIALGAGHSIVPPSSIRGSETLHSQDDSSAAQEAAHRVLLGNTHLQSQVLEYLHGIERYNAWLADLAQPWLGSHPLELGGGIGGYTARWLANGTPRITTTEVDEGRLQGLRDRFADDPRVDVHSLWFGDDHVPGAGRFSSLVSFNVLEHVHDDVAALASARRLVEPGGRVIIFVPAFQALMSDFDRAIGHVRRYTRSSITRTFVEAGLTVESTRYVNAPGFFAWWLGMKVMRMAPRDGVTVAAWDRLVIPVARFVESHIAPPVGQSVLCVASVPR